MTLICAWSRAVCSSSMLVPKRACSEEQPHCGVVQLWGAEVAPLGLRGETEVLQEGGQAAGAAAKVETAERAGDRPPQTEGGRDDLIQLLLGHHALDHEVDRLAEERGLQPVGDESRHLPAQHAWLLAERRVEADGVPYGLRIGLLAPDHLHQRDEVRRVEGMADDQRMQVTAVVARADDTEQPPERHAGAAEARRLLHPTAGEQLRHTWRERRLP